MPQPLHVMTACQLLAAMDQGELTSEQLTRHLLGRIRTHNPSLNAVVALDEEHALTRARAADRQRAQGDRCGPLHGLPMTVKDTWEVPGLPCAAGSPDLARYHPEQPADVIDRLTDAGAIILGKTNVPYLASDLQSYNRVYGTSNNPWNPERTPGGSSGGSAAALAAGLTPLEVGSDLAGSIRTPAHFCGVFGHKPSRSLVSFRGHVPGPPGTLTQPDLAEGGPMARSAADLELLLSVIAGPRPAMARSWQLAMEPARFSELSGVRIGLWLEDHHCPVDHEQINGLRRLADELTRLGAVVSTPRHPLLSLERLLPAYFNLLGSLMSGGLSARQKRQLRLFALAEKPLQKVRQITFGMPEYARATSQSIADWMRWNEAREKMRDDIEQLFTDVDVLLTPVNPVTAIRHDHRDPQYRRQIRVNGEVRPYMNQFCWAAPASLLGLPATTAPVGRTREGLPYGVQILSAPGRDLTTLRFAQLLEKSGLSGYQVPSGF